MTPGQFKRKREKLFPAVSQNKSRELAAAALGVSKVGIAHWEYGVRKVPQMAVNFLELLERVRFLESQL